jgi:hypothetical protein
LKDTRPPSGGASPIFVVVVLGWLNVNHRDRRLDLYFLDRSGRPETEDITKLNGR